MLGITESRRLDEKVDPDDDFLTGLDAILVLGGGRPSSPSDPPPYVKNRVDVAARLYSAAAALGGGRGRPPPTILCLSAGTAHVPNLPNPPGSPGSAGGPAVYESTASAAYLFDRHPSVRREDVQVETTSYDTISNAYYSRVAHADPSGWRRIVVVTSGFHMERSRAIFDWVYGAASGERGGSDGKKYELRYREVPDVGLTAGEVAARKEREGRSAANVRTKLAPRHPALRDVLKFLTTEHDLYSAEGLIARSKVSTDGAVGSGVDESVVKSYGGGASAGGSGGRRAAWNGIVSNAGFLAAASVAAFFLGRRSGASSAEGRKFHSR